MPRPPRTAHGGLVYHVLNRANARRRIFETPGDYAAFVRMLADIQTRSGMRILAWCVMPNHWHLVLWPREDGELSAFVRLVTLTHTQRWHAHRGTAGTGHLYQGRFKSFVVQADGHLLTVCRYVEANALRAKLVGRAEDWRWSSLWRHGADRPAIAPWPVPQPSGWIDAVNEVGSAGELDRLRACNQRGRPYGDHDWMMRKVAELGLALTIRPRGRPPKTDQEKVPDTFSG
jgi:putative transposase